MWSLTKREAFGGLVKVTSTPAGISGEGGFSGAKVSPGTAMSVGLISKLL